MSSGEYIATLALPVARPFNPTARPLFAPRRDADASLPDICLRLIRFVYTDLVSRAVFTTIYPVFSSWAGRRKEIARHQVRSHAGETLESPCQRLFVVRF